MQVETKQFVFQHKSINLILKQQNNNNKIMSNTTLTPFSLKVPEDSKTLFEELFDRAKEQRPTLTKGAFFEEMAHAFANPKTVEKTVDNPEHLEKIEQLTKELEFEKETALGLSQNIFDFGKSLSALFDDEKILENEEIIAEIQRTQQRAMSVPTEVQRPLAENEILFSIPEPHLSLLKVTAERLNTTIKDILLDMFVKYTIEQRAQWFYPFVIKSTEFETITGHSHQTLEQWLKKTTQK